jgi:hypothetical protein
MVNFVPLHSKTFRVEGFVLAFFCLLAASCDLPPGLENGKGSLAIVLPGGSLRGQRIVTGTRAVHLPEEITNNMSYSLQLKSDNGSFKSLSDIRDRVVTLDLTPGHWFILATASYGTTQAGISKAETDIQAGRENSVSLTMEADEFIAPYKSSWESNSIYIGTGNAAPPSFSIDIVNPTEFSSIFPGNMWQDDFSYEGYYTDADGNAKKTNCANADNTYLNSKTLTVKVDNSKEGNFYYYVKAKNDYTYTSSGGEIITDQAVTTIPVGNVTVVNGTTLEIGGTGPGGGIVFYAGTDFIVNGKVCHYLEAGPSLGQPQWGASDSSTGAMGGHIGAGWTNTQIIVAALNGKETDRAAQIASAYNGGGLSDWFLPSEDELRELYNSGCFGSDTPIWTSTEYSSNATMACRIRRSDGRTEVVSKYSDITYVRPIRAF